MKKSSIIFCSLIATNLIPLYQAAADTTDTTVLDEVVVSASRTEEAKKDVSANIEVITNEEIKESASTNVADLLAEKNLGHIQKYPGSNTSVSIRGLSTDVLGNDLQGQVLVLLDGRRAGSGNLSKFLTKNVERIEIIKGPGAVQYGSAGMGGVINIITKQAKENSAFIETGGGSFDTFETSAGWTTVKNNFDFSGAISYGSSGDYETGSGDTYSNTGVDSELGISANLGYTFAETQRIGLIVTGSKVDGAGSPEYFSDPDLDDSMDNHNYSADLNYKGATSDNSTSWFMRFFAGQDDNTWISPTASNPTLYDTGIDSTNTTDQMGAQAQLSHVFGATTLTGGIDWLDYDIENSYTPEETEYQNPAVFMLGKTLFLAQQNLALNYGLRYDWFHVSVIDPEGRDEDDDNLTPMVGIAWQFAQDWKLRTQYAEGFVVPSAEELAADYSTSYSTVVGNSDLEPEKSKTYEIGVDYDKNSFNASLTFFHTDYEDMITTDYLSDGSQTWTNIGEATLEGIETSFSYDIGSLLGVDWEIAPYISLTYFTDYTDEETGDNIEYMSDTQVSGGMHFSNGHGTYFRINVAYTGSQDVDDYESGTYPYPVIEMDPFTVVNLSAATKVYESATLGSFSVRGQITNLFDEDYAYVDGYEMPGIGFFVSLRWDF